MLNQILSTVLQLAVVCLIPFLVFIIKNRSPRGFLDYIGLKRSPAKANGLAALGSLVLALPLLVLALVDAEMREVFTAPATVVGNLRGMGSTGVIVFSVILTSIFKTSLSEEIFFRGFVAKRLIALLGFGLGNSLQAIIFGILHVVIFLQITGNAFFLCIIFVFPALAALLFGYLNERMAGGSIVPGWIAHGLGNLVAYSLLVFLI